MTTSAESEDFERGQRAARNEHAGTVGADLAGAVEVGHHRHVGGQVQIGVRGDHAHPACPTIHELIDGGVGDNLSLPKHDDMVGDHRHFAHQVAREHDGAPFGGEVFEQVAHPQHPVGYPLGIP